MGGFSCFFFGGVWSFFFGVGGWEDVGHFCFRLENDGKKTALAATYHQMRGVGMVFFKW